MGPVGPSPLDTFFLPWSTYQWALETAGFQSIEVQESLPLSPELEQQLGREHWAYLLENPAYILIEGQKAASPTPG